MPLPPSINRCFTKSVLRTHYILEALREVGPAGRKVHFLYDSLENCLSFVELTSPKVRRRGPGQSPDRHAWYVPNPPFLLEPSPT